MKQILFATLFTLIASAAFSQHKLSGNELSVNAFRNPSIGLEYRRNHVSVHAGYYTTAFKAGEFTNFIKAGATYWFLPRGTQAVPSAFYAGASYLRGINREYKNVNAFAAEAGYRWAVWKGLNLRIGVIALAAEGKSVKVNPTPGISYSFRF